MSSKTITIVQAPDKDNPFAVIYKPQSLASAPLHEGEDCALTQAAELFPQIKTVHGKKEIEYGLLHRLDTETEGLLLIATTQSAYDALTQSQASGLFIKKYHAFCDQILPDYEDGFSVCPFQIQAEKLPQTIRITSRFRSYGKGGAQVRPVTEQNGTWQKKKASERLYTTDITLTKGQDGIEAECTICNGYRHQVRCHLAWTGYPVQGDHIYNPSAKESDKGLAFKATSFLFPHPVTGQTVSFKA